MTRVEAILEARRMYANGEFKRSVTGKPEPEHLWNDIVPLECGHKVPWLQPYEHSGFPNSGGRPVPESINCSECALVWLEGHADTPHFNSYTRRMENAEIRASLKREA